MIIYTLIIYNLILLFSTLFAYFATYAFTKIQRLISRLFCFLVLFLPASIRYGIGTDYFAYVDIFNHIDFDNSYLEPGYTFLNVVLSSNGMDSQWIFIVSSFIIYGVICFGLPRKYYVYYILIFVLLFYLRSYNIIRQSIAVSFIFVACLNYNQNKKLYYLLVTLASLFHYSAILLYFIGLINAIKIRKNTFFLFVIILVVVVKINLIGLILNSDLVRNSLYGNYIDSEFNTQTSIGSGIGIIIRTLIPFIIVINGYKLSKNKNMQLFVWLSYIYILAYSMALQIFIFKRIVDAFVFVPIIGFPLICTIFNKHRKLILLMIILLFIANYEKIILDSRSILESGNGVTPYRTIFNF